MATLRPGIAVAAALSLTLAPGCRPPAGPARPASPEGISADQVAHHVRILASDLMEGRGLGTRGLDASGEYVADEMRRAGLAPGGPDGSWFQPFDMTVGVQLGSRNALALVGAARNVSDPKRSAFEGKASVLAIDRDWRPLEFSDSGSVHAPAVFVGYGITAPELGWDDYAGVDVTGKIAVVLRHEPGEKDPKSVFGGADLTRYAELRVKAINARVHGAVGMVLVNDALPHEGDEDLLLALDPDGGVSFAGIPAVHLRREPAAALFGGADGLLAAERVLAEGGRPSSKLLPGSIGITVDLAKRRLSTRNVVGVLAGRDASLQHEAIVIGAHYDHIGMGGRDSLDPNRAGTPHNGADDNASGTSALLAIARAIASSGVPTRRSIVFIAFSAEEAGLGGSSWYVGHPTWPLERIAAMLNMDMVGRMRDRKLVAFGADTAAEFSEILRTANTETLEITARGDGYGPSDQTAFYGKGIPVLHFFTGAHADYHRTTDDADRIDADGLASVARLVKRVAIALANRDGRPTFVPSTSIPHAFGQTGSTGGYGAYFGSVPDFTESELPGVPITGVRAGSPAEKAGLAGGDRIVKFGDVTVANLHDLTFALRKFKPGDEVEVGFVRDGQTRTVRAVLSKRE